MSLVLNGEGRERLMQPLGLLKPDEDLLPLIALEERKLEILGIVNLSWHPIERDLQDLDCIRAEEVGKDIDGAKLAC